MKTQANTIGAGTLVRTSHELLNTCLLLLRMTIGILLFVAGAGKLLGWFGGFGMDATIGFYAKMGIPVSLTYMSAYAEFIGGLLVAIGLFTRPAAFAVLINMVVATVLTLPNGFLAPMGASYPFIFAVLALVILLAGPMAYSLDSLILVGNRISREKVDWNSATLIRKAA